MKKYFLLTVAAIAALASCQKNEGPAVELSQGPAIAFSTYTASPVTKGTIITGTSVEDPNAELNEIGVFAFYQQNANGNPVNFNTHKFACPDYMYNQKVKNADNVNWIYNPVKYWPNTPGDQLSFFAYAPYSADKNWEELGIATDAVGKKMTVSFPIYSVKSDMIDYLWATPQINKKNASTVETGGYQVADKVTFNFKHITSQISLYIGAEKEGTAKTPSIWSTDTETEITVDNIIFKGLAESMTYTYAIPEITAEPGLSLNGKQDIVLSSDDFSDKKSSKNWDDTKFMKLLAQEKNAKDVDEDGFLWSTHLLPLAVRSQVKRKIRDQLRSHTALTKLNHLVGQQHRAFADLQDVPRLNRF